ncbi:MAG TPA: serine hydrolase domain-containing protein [Anaerolineae bacterium]|nr:serine hydrolase domain-containing protein [Anaerolineae bacterium]
MSVEELVGTIDAWVGGQYGAAEPGAAVIVQKNGETIYRKGVGLANLEWQIAVEPEMVFRLASISKQFTAVSVLMLVEAGELALTDRLTKFLPDYPTNGHVITVEQLLAHTSGIKSYTDMPEWLADIGKDYTVEEMIALFKGEPMPFAPDTRWQYNNSGYVLLGAIIEKVSGQTYAEFVSENIFKPLEMKDSYYDMAATIIPKRVSGYEGGEGAYVNARYLSMTQVYAAGGLMSTVDDLARWDEALYTDKLVKQTTLEKAFTSYKLKDGRDTKYGYGWTVSTYEGLKVVEHSGGIFGFATHIIRIPEEKILVAVLSNNPSKPASMLGFKVAVLLAGKVYEEPVGVEIDISELGAYVGVYETEERKKWEFEIEDGGLWIIAEGEGRFRVEGLGDDWFFLPHAPMLRLMFERDEVGEITGIVLSGRTIMSERVRRVG